MMAGGKKGKADMVPPVKVELDEDAMDFGDDSLLDDLDNLDGHCASFFGDADNKINDDDIKELRSTNLVSRRTTCEKTVKFEDLDFKMVIGRGAFGKVFLAQLRGEEKLYAVKSLRKDVLIEYQ